MSLRIENLRVYYRTLAGDVQALDGVTFGIADGEIMGLAGESGCGKSTLGNSLIRLTGRMRYVGGRSLSTATELPIWNSEAMNQFRFKHLSIIPQYAMSAMNPTRKIGKMAGRAARFAGHRATKAYVPELRRRLELVGLSEDVLDMYPIELSGGMKQRVVMVISTLLNPSLLIADEITSALDVSTQKAVAETLVEFRDRGFVKTHDRDHPRPLDPLPGRRHDPRSCTPGKLAEKAPPRRSSMRPRHPYTRLLISSLPEVGVRFAEQAAGGHPGTAAVAARPAGGLPLPRPLPARRRAVRRGAAVRRDRARPLVACWKVG